MTDYLFSILIGYFIGSFPSAYLLVKLKTKKDIRKEGSGIVGTFNTFEVTQSKTVGALVLIIDILKGVAVVLLIKILYGNLFPLMAVSGIGAILGHDFPVWLKFKGGRGLAVTAGIMLVFGWVFIVAWIALFGVTYVLSKNLHLGNIIATIFCPLALAVIPPDIYKYVLPGYISRTEFICFGIVVCSLILLRHTDSIKNLFKKKTD